MTTQPTKTYSDTVDAYGHPVDADPAYWASLDAYHYRNVASKVNYAAQSAYFAGRTARATALYKDASLLMKLANKVLATGNRNLPLPKALTPGTRKLAQ